MRVQTIQLFSPAEYEVESAPALDESHVEAVPRAGPRPALQVRLSASVASLVEEFHLAFGLPVSAGPNSDVPPELVRLRQDLIGEEVSELCRAMDERDLISIAQELADVAYVLYGTALTYGIDLDAAVAEVHRSNLTKLDAGGKPSIRNDGKVLKGPAYEPPDLTTVLYVDLREPSSE